MLEKIKLLLSRLDDSEDELISTLIAMCKEETCIYCNLPEYDSKLDVIVIQMVVEKYNRIGSEGTTNQSNSGASASYVNFYSDKIIRMLNKFRKVRAI